MDKEKTAKLWKATRSYGRQFFMELVSQRLELMSCRLRERCWCRTSSLRKLQSTGACLGLAYKSSNPFSVTLSWYKVNKDITTGKKRTKKLRRKRTKIYKDLQTLFDSPETLSYEFFITTFARLAGKASEEKIIQL